MVITAQNTNQKPGYKQTEVGEIPEDWVVENLGSITTLLTNGFVGKATDFYTESDDGVFYIQGYNVEESAFNLHGIKRVSWKFHAQHQKSCLQVGDLLTIQTGDIGVTTVVPQELAGANCHALVISRLDKRFYVPQYYCQYFNSKRGRDTFKEIETGSTMKHLNVGDMRRLFLPVPLRPEQCAIATALSDVDALITSLDKLIAKKHDIKRATMQQLLTGKTRLPGFSDEWKSASIEQLENGGILKLSRGKVISNKDIKRCPGDYPIYSSSIKNSGLFGRYGEYMFNDELITWSIDGGGDFFYRHKHRFSVTNVSGIMRVDTSIIDYRFLAPELELIHTQLAFDYQIKAHPSVIRKLYTLFLPSLDEQQAIATILSDMDAEIAALEQRRDKTCALKQGMMQELLTGKTRLL